VRHCFTKAAIIHLLCVLAFTSVNAQDRPAPAVSPQATARGDSIARDASVDGGGPKVVFRRGGSRQLPNVSLTGWPAALFLLSFFGGIVALVWRLLFLRRRARVLTRASETQYKSLFEQNPCALFVYDSRTQEILTANTAAAAMLDYTDDAFKRLKLRDLFAGAIAGDAMHELRGGARANPNSPLATQMCRRDGSIIDVEAREQALDSHGAHARLVMVIDVTERLAADERARASSELLRSLIGVSPQAILALDREYRVTLWNGAAEQLFGWSADEVIGHPVPYLPDKHRANYLERKALIGEKGFIGPAELTRLHKDGTAIDVLATAGVVVDADGDAAGYIGVFTDLTQHRQLEAQLRQSQKMEAVGRLAGGLAHDFNNMLTVITSYVEILQAQHSSDGDTDDLAQIAAATSRAALLTRQLLTFSRKQIVQHSPVNVNDVVARIEPMLRRVSAENIVLRTSLASDLAAVLADEGQLEQVILNLAVNAADAMPNGGSLLLETANVELDDDYVLSHPEVIPGRYVMLAASDTGCGMSESTLSKVFEPFFTTKEPGRGTGLGLATAYAIVRQAGGHIWVYSEVGSGTTFKIYLPRIESGAPTRKTPSRASTSVGRGGTVLLVEDDDDVRRGVSATLARLGYAVLEAPDGEAALVVAASHGGTIDVVVTDLMMPGMNGRELGDQLAALQPHLRVVFTSGYTDDEVVRRRLVNEGQSFLQKPFTSEQLVRAIEMGG
jgi:two-component system cell cycle sensor histidine kinase/response regulator CckA